MDHAENLKSKATQSQVPEVKKPCLLPANSVWGRVGGHDSHKQVHTQLPTLLGEDISALTPHGPDIKSFGEGTPTSYRDGRNLQSSPWSQWKSVSTDVGSGLQSVSQSASAESPSNLASTGSGDVSNSSGNWTSPSMMHSASPLGSISENGGWPKSGACTPDHSRSRSPRSIGNGIGNGIGNAQAPSAPTSFTSTFSSGTDNSPRSNCPTSDSPSTVHSQAERLQAVLTQYIRKCCLHVKRNLLNYDAKTPAPTDLQLATFVHGFAKNLHRIIEREAQPWLQEEEDLDGGLGALEEEDVDGPEAYDDREVREDGRLNGDGPVGMQEGGIEEEENDEYESDDNVLTRDGGRNAGSTGKVGGAEKSGVDKNNSNKNSNPNASTPQLSHNTGVFGFGRSSSEFGRSDSDNTPVFDLDRLDTERRRFGSSPGHRSLASATSYTSASAQSAVANLATLGSISYASFRTTSDEHLSPARAQHLQLQNQLRAIVAQLKKPFSGLYDFENNCRLISADTNGANLGSGTCENAEEEDAGGEDGSDCGKETGNDSKPVDSKASATKSTSTRNAKPSAVTSTPESCCLPLPLNQLLYILNSLEQLFCTGNQVLNRLRAEDLDDRIRKAIRNKDFPFNVHTHLTKANNYTAVYYLFAAGTKVEITLTLRETDGAALAEHFGGGELGRVMEEVWELEVGGGSLNEVGSAEKDEEKDKVESQKEGDGDNVDTNVAGPTRELENGQNEGSKKHGKGTKVSKSKNVREKKTVVCLSELTTNPFQQKRSKLSEMRDVKMRNVRGSGNALQAKAEGGGKKKNRKRCRDEEEEEAAESGKLTSPSGSKADGTNTDCAHTPTNDNGTSNTTNCTSITNPPSRALKKRARRTQQATVAKFKSRYHVFEWKFQLFSGLDEIQLCSERSNGRFTASSAGKWHSGEVYYWDEEMDY